MKKILYCLLLLSMFLFGCDDVPNFQENLCLPVKITASLEGSNAYFIADITQTDCKITFDPQHSLYGTELYFSQEGNKATVGDFTRDIKEGCFPAQEALIKGIRGICQEEIKSTETEYGAKYTIDEMSIMVYYDKENGIINAIGTEENGRYFKFNIISFSHYEG